MTALDEKTSAQTAEKVKFKTLRTVDAHTLDTKPLELAPPRPSPVRFENANGGLRLVDRSEVRLLAAASVKRLLAAKLGEVVH